MGFFSANEHSNLYGNFTFPDIEGYCGTIGCGAAIVEGYQNDWALFEAQVFSDMSEIQTVNEGGDIVPLQEASLKGMWEAIKKFFIKLGAKIKAIFKAFCAKLESYFTKDLNGFVKKYERQLDNKDFKDMKVKCAKIKSGGYVMANDPYPAFNRTIFLDFEGDPKIKELKDKERSDISEEFYKNATNNGADDAKSFDTWYHDELYEAEEVRDNFTTSDVRTVAARLKDNTKTVKTIDDKSKKVLKEIQSIIKDIDKAAGKINALYSGSADGKTNKLSHVAIAANPNSRDINTSDTSKAVMEPGDTSVSVDISSASDMIQAVRKEASVYQEVVMHISQTIMKEAKYGIGQDKKLFTAAVAYKSYAAESTLLDAIAECASDEVEEYFNNTRVIA